jgi:flagellar hook-length control protein FliK
VREVEGAALPAQATARASALAQPTGTQLATPTQALAATIRLADQRGFSHARLALNPPELGGVEVLLRSSSSGIVASLTADTPEAARLLEAGTGDLRRQLEAQGIELLRVDVDVAGDRRAASGGGDGQNAAAQPATAHGGPAATTADQPDGPATTHRIALGGGVLIDVIA